MSRITRLTLNQFRNYDAARLELDAQTVIFTGANGAGKTNILEALSLLNPKYGLKGAALDQLKNIHAMPHELCAITAELKEAPQLRTKISTYLKKEGESLKREIKIDERLCTSQSMLLEHLYVQWLTPQMDGLFLGPAAERRRFLDRMVTIFDHAHMGRLSRLDKLWRERALLLQQGARADFTWLDSLEHKIAETVMTVQEARLEMITRLQFVFARLEHLLVYFPRPLISAVTALPFAGQSALELEEQMRAILKADRPADMVVGKNVSGLHRFDFEVTHQQQGMKAPFCSTGDQKALLISLVLGFAHLVKAEKGRPPILLLDEVVAHLDAGRRDALQHFIKALGTQVFLSGTEPLLFTAWRGEAVFLKVEHGRIFEEEPLQREISAGA